MSKKMGKVNMKKILLIFAVILSACTFQTKHRGYVFPENLENKLANVKTISALVDAIGAPQVKTVYGDDVWVDENEITRATQDDIDAFFKH